MNSLAEIIKKDNENRNKYEKELEELCSQSNRLNYKDLINRLEEITEHKIPVGSYKFTSFVEWLVEDLENSSIVNADCWDMTIDEIKAECDNDSWESEYNKFKDDKDFNFKNAEEFKDNMMDWSYTYSIDGIFSGLQHEYKRRKDMGLIE